MKKDLDIWYGVGIALVVAGLLLMVLSLILTPDKPPSITTEKTE